MGNRSTRIRVWAIASAVMLVAVGCNDGDAVFAPADRAFEGGGVVGISSSAPTLLRAPESCDDLVAGFRQLAEETQLGYGYAGDVAVDVAMETSAGTADNAASADALPAADRDSSSETNTQEAGIDEPDLVENDGDYVYTFAAAGESEELVILDGATAEVVGRVALGTRGNSMLLSGDRLLVISEGAYGYGRGPAPMPEIMPVDTGTAVSEPVPPGVEPPGDVDPVEPIEPPGFSVGTTIQLIDVADRSAPQIVETTELEGYHNTTRVVDGVARIVISSYPEIYPVETTGDFELAMDGAIRDAEIEDWLPSYRTISKVAGDSSVAAEGQVVDCDQVLLPEVNAGSGETSVLRVDFAQGFDPADTTTVVADAETVYASANTLYIAATRWDGAETFANSASGPEAMSTAVHAFDLAGDGAATHAAAGEVSGQMLNQYAMSEHDGDLRVATTERMFSDASESGVRVLRRNGETLEEIGAVTGLGVTETIQSVRFMGDTAYVVTFRQTDPLYVIDLADPTNPKAVGELKIPGFSSYLHPIGDDLLVGVGRNADDEGRDTGFLVSVFDVSDPTAPIQVDTFTDDAISSPAGFDPKSFLWWDEEGVVVVPFERYESGSTGTVDLPVGEDGSVTSSPDEFSSGLLVLDVGAEGISERGVVSGDQGDQKTWSRGLVVQDRLWGLYASWGSESMEGGVAVTDFADLDGAEFHPFG